MHLKSKLGREQRLSDRNHTESVVWGALPDIADTQVDDLLQTDQSVGQ